MLDCYCNNNYFYYHAGLKCGRGKRCGFLLKMASAPSLSLSELFHAGYKIEREVDSAALVASNKEFIVRAVKPACPLVDNLYN